MTLPVIPHLFHLGQDQEKQTIDLPNRLFEKGNKREVSFLCLLVEQQSLIKSHCLCGSVPVLCYTMPWKTLCGFPPTRHEVTLLIPNGSWRPDTVITDSFGNEYFVLLDVENKMRSYEAIFGDLEGNRLVCIKRHLKKAFWKDGFYFCTYRPNYKGQRALRERDRDNKRVYPHSYVRLEPLKGRFYYSFFDDQQELARTRLYAENQWLGMMMVCCTPIMRWGRFTGRFKKKDNSTQIFVDQWRNSVKVLPGQDVLASLCLAYIFDKCQSQPMVAVMGRESDDEYESDGSIDSNEEYDYEDDNYYRDHPDEKAAQRSGEDGELQFENMPDSSQREEFDEEYFAEDEEEVLQQGGNGQSSHPYNNGAPLPFGDSEDPDNKQGAYYDANDPYNHQTGAQPFVDAPQQQVYDDCFNPQPQQLPPSEGGYQADIPFEQQQNQQLHQNEMDPHISSRNPPELL